MTPVITADHLTIRFGDFTAVSDVSFEIPSNTALAVLGPNGAGKSTLARALSGLVPKAGGSVRFGDADTRLVGL